MLRVRSRSYSARQSGILLIARQLLQSSISLFTLFPRALPWAGIGERLRRFDNTSTLTKGPAKMKRTITLVLIIVAAVSVALGQTDKKEAQAKLDLMQLERDIGKANIESD